VQLMNVKDGIALTGVEKIISFFPEESVQTQEKWRSAFREMLNLVPTSHLKNVYVYPCYDDNGEIETLQYVGLHDDIFSFANAIPFRDLLYSGNTLENKIKGKISDAPLPDFIHTYCDEIQQFSEYANTFMLQKQDMKSTDIDFGDIM
jgi:hypothetical protein